MPEESTAGLVAAIRAALGETQEGLARRIGVSFPTINAWERGRSDPRARHRKALEELAAEAGIRVDAAIMIIDDDLASIEILSALVHAADPRIHVEWATDGSTGLLKCGALQPNLLFLDIMMPGLNGLDVARRMATVDALADTDIVFITSSQDAEVLGAARELGRAVLAKPLDPDRVSNELQELLG